MVDYDIIPTKDLYELLLTSEEFLMKLKHEYEIYTRSTASILSAAINRKNGKGQMGFDDWDESKIKPNWKKLI